MTVVVGALCTDGVVVGSDSSATLGVPPHFATIEQPAQKVFVIEPDVVFAGTGHAGLGQRFGHLLRATREELDFLSSDEFSIVRNVSRRAIEDFEFTRAPKGEFGALMALSCASGPHLCEFDLTHFQPELKTPKNWFSSMGSGQAIADPFLGMIRRVFFPNVQPRLNEGVFAVAWTIIQAIDLNPGGIKEPLQIAVLAATEPGGPLSSRLLDAHELSEHRLNVQAAEAHLGEYRRLLSTDVGPPIPEREE